MANPADPFPEVGDDPADPFPETMSAPAPDQPAEAGLLESAGQVPGELVRMLMPASVGGGAVSGGVDLGLARSGDYEAARRVRARQFIIGSVAGALVPGGPALRFGAEFLPALAVRAGLGALGGGVAAGAEAAAGGQEILPAAGAGAIGGALINPVFGFLHGPNVVAQSAEDLATKPPKVQLLPTGELAPAEDLAISAAARLEGAGKSPAKELSPAVSAQAESEAKLPSFQRAAIQAARAGVTDRVERLQVASAVLGRKVNSFKELAGEEVDQVTHYFRQLSNPETAAAAIEDGASRATSLVTQALDRAPGNIGEALADGANSYHYIATAGDSFLRKLGPAGNQLADVTNQARVNSLGRIGREGVQLENLAKQFSDPAERIQIGRIMEGAPTSDPKLANAARELGGILKVYRTEMEQVKLPVLERSSGQISPFTGMENYLPRIYTDRTIQKYAPAAERALLMRQFRKLPSKIRSANAQFAREMDLPGYEQDAFQAVAMYIDRTAPRVEQAKLLGTGDELASQLLDQIGAESGRSQQRMASEIYKAQVHPAGREPAPFASLLKELATPLFLTYSGIVQPSQVFTNTVSREGVMNTVKGIARYITSKDGRQAAMETGAAVKNAAEDMVKEGGISEKWSTVIGLRGLDRVNRLTSALAAQYRARDVVQELARGKTTPGVLRDATRLGLDPRKLAEQNWVLTPQQLNEAGLRGSISTQFLADALSTPLAKQSGWGGVVYLYKSFLLNQGRFTKDLVKSAQAGHWGPLARYVGSLGTVGVAYGEAVRTIKGQPPKDDPVWRFLDDLSTVGSVSAFGEMMRAMGTSTDAVYSFIAGPVISEAVRTGVEGVAAARGEPEALQRHALQRTIKRIPFVGQDLYETYAP